MRDETGSQESIRARIIAAGAELLSVGGREALTTRAVAAAAHVQAPTIYRLFGDKNGLLDAVAHHGLAQFVAEKRALAPLPDPLDNLRFGWDVNIAFGIAHPAIFAIINSGARPGELSPVATAGLDILRARVRLLARAGLLRVPEDRAVSLIRVAGVGTTLTLLSMPEAERDPGLSSAAYDAVVAAITTTSPAPDRPGPAAAAIALRASLDEAAPLTPGERALLTELLDRLAR